MKLRLRQPATVEWRQYNQIRPGDIVRLGSSGAYAIVAARLGPPFPGGQLLVNLANGRVSIPSSHGEFEVVEWMPESG